MPKLLYTRVWICRRRKSGSGASFGRKEGGHKEDLDEEIENLTDIEVEASIAAERIQQLAGTEIYDSKQAGTERRNTGYGRAAQNHQGWATVFQDVFARKESRFMPMLTQVILKLWK